mmetsp:Transcript_10612/g.29960  ORF Transcript_10612/g.29960 Transcript_10612/m.29960 type:complete len:211 (+) Transcript_10612:210-842(+)
MGGELVLGEGLGGPRDDAAAADVAGELHVLGALAGVPVEGLDHLQAAEGGGGGERPPLSLEEGGGRGLGPKQQQRAARGGGGKVREEEERLPRCLVRVAPLVHVPLYLQLVLRPHERYVEHHIEHRWHELVHVLLGAEGHEGQVQLDQGGRDRLLRSRDCALVLRELQGERSRGGQQERSPRGLPLPHLVGLVRSRLYHYRQVPAEERGS